MYNSYWKYSYTCTFKSFSERIIHIFMGGGGGGYWLNLEILGFQNTSNLPNESTVQDELFNHVPF